LYSVRVNIYLLTNLNEDKEHVTKGMGCHNKLFFLTTNFNAVSLEYVTANTYYQCAHTCVHANGREGGWPPRSAPKTYSNYLGNIDIGYI